METKRVLSIIFSILFIGAFAFVLSWGIINFNKVQDGISGTGVYTKDDIDNAYKDGYSTALDNEKEYTELIDSYRDTITLQTDQISQLNIQVITLTNNNRDYTNQISTLENEKLTLEQQVSNLIIIKSNNELTISGLNDEISQLQKEIAELTYSGSDKDEIIAQKNSLIINLQSTISQLQKTNELNVETINNLNNQITTLNIQITDMTLQIQNNSKNVTALNNKIAELEKSVSYYEQYISNLENGEQVVVTFEFNGSVYNIQIVNKNHTVSVVNPTSTDYVIFNYWTVNGEQIDLSTYQITSNTRVVANVTYKYDVKFMVDVTEYDKQIVIKNGYATIPTNPTKTGYEFDGWTINGIDIVNPNITAITQNTVYVAKFTKLHTVTFMYEDSIYETKLIRNNEYSSNVIVENTNYKLFNGWKLNGAIIDVTTQKIVADTTFVADITYNYDVKFMVDDTIYNEQIIIENGFAITPTNPTKTGYEFDGWTINTIDIVNPNTTSITQNTVFVAKFTKVHSVVFNVDDTNFNTQLIRDNEMFVIPENPTKTGYIFLGWSINGEVIEDFTSYSVIEDLIFNAEFMYSTFTYDDFDKKISTTSNYTTITLTNNDFKNIIDTGLATKKDFNLNLIFNYETSNSLNTNNVLISFNLAVSSCNFNLSVTNLDITTYTGNAQLSLSFNTDGNLVLRFAKTQLKYLIMSSDAELDLSSISLSIDCTK